MNSIIIESSPEFGLRFYGNAMDGPRQLLHEVSVATLMQMSLSDFEHCVAANSFVELKNIHHFFEDYLWKDDGQTRPKKEQNVPR